MNEQHRIAIIGDVMRDVTIEVAVDRVSPEAPCLIGRHLSETHTAGGAGNVAANVRALSGDDVTVGLIDCYRRRYSVEGVDFADLIYGDDVWPRDVDWISNNRTCERFHLPRKTRHIARGQQVYRHDEEGDADTTPRADDFAAAVIDWSPTALIFADYRKGICTPSLVGRLMQYARTNRIPTFVDTKPDAVAMYRGATLMKLNRIEAAAVYGAPIVTIDDALTAAGSIVVREAIENVVVTLDRDGLVWCHGDAEMVEAGHLGAVNRNPVDVTGAGDTTLAALAVSMLRGSSLEGAARFASLCAGEVVGVRGTAVAGGVMP
jgi:D-beta-D-heptose 7-phosphate kinase/D-beta-D-heptose 1-phosphate adenosyltransferase